MTKFINFIFALTIFIITGYGISPNLNNTNGDKGANTGYKITTSADTYNRQLHQREIDFINNKNNITSFKSKLQTTTNKIYSDDETKSILAKAALSLTDRSFNEAYRQNLSSNDLYNIKLATNFIKQSSFYNTTLDNTNAFNPNKKQYEDRYMYLDSFTNNREFYDKNLKVDTSYLDNTLGFIDGIFEGGSNLIKDTATGLYHLVTTPIQTAKGIANTVLNADTLIYNGLMKSELDIILGDYSSVTARDFEFIAGLTGAGLVTKKAGKAGNRLSNINLSKKGTTTDKTTNNNLKWTSWDEYEKVVLSNKEYAKIGNRLYTHHAVDRMQPSSLGSPAGTIGSDRNISPNIVEITIKEGVKSEKMVYGVNRNIYQLGDVRVVTKNNDNIIISVIRASQ